MNQLQYHVQYGVCLSILKVINTMHITTSVDTHASAASSPASARDKSTSVIPSLRDAYTLQHKPFILALYKVL